MCDQKFIISFDYFIISIFSAIVNNLSHPNIKCIVYHVHTGTIKQLAFHAHFLSTFLVIAKHLYDPPSMPPIPGFGIIGVTFALAILLPPVGMISPDGFANKKEISKGKEDDSQTKKTD